MVNPSFPERQPQSSDLVLPTRITLRAATPTKSLYLLAYCSFPEQVANAISRTIRQAGGVSLCHSGESDRFSQQLLIGAQLPSLSHSELGKIRMAIQTAGSMVDTVRLNYQVRHPAKSLNQRPPACVGCHYYYGKSHGNTPLICAMHPFGPSEHPCRDWTAAYTIQN
ncbi:MAG: hypothetical protein BRC57_12370 [Cyanobacteria bacterium QS_8_48_54]|nr:MAG: hypothetical protein BRC57_12370 [Cyanobacteria bacterium QS_8_48_54]